MIELVLLIIRNLIHVPNETGGTVGAPRGSLQTGVAPLHGVVVDHLFCIHVFANSILMVLWHICKGADDGRGTLQDKCILAFHQVGILDLVISLVRMLYLETLMLMFLFCRNISLTRCCCWC